MERGRRRFLKGAGLAVSAGAFGLPAARAGEARLSQPPTADDMSAGMPRGLDPGHPRSRWGAEPRGEDAPGRARREARRGRASSPEPPRRSPRCSSAAAAPALAGLVERAAEGARATGSTCPRTRRHFGPCVTHPEKIICVGLNYRKHAAETGNPVPETPILFNKYNTALSGPRRRPPRLGGGRRCSSTTRSSW